MRHVLRAPGGRSEVTSVDSLGLGDQRSHDVPAKPNARLTKDEDGPEVFGAARLWDKTQRSTLTPEARLAFFEAAASHISPEGDKVMVFNPVVDLGHVVESRTILVIWFTLAILAFAHMHLQVPLAGALDRATSDCPGASLPPVALLLNSPLTQAISPHKRCAISMVDPHHSASLPRAHSCLSPSSTSLP